MDPAIQTEIECSKPKMPIMDTKIDFMKRQLEEMSNSQTTELKRIRFSKPHTFQKGSRTGQNNN